MRFAILLIFAVLLNGCAKQPVASETIAESTQNSIVAIEKTLPSNCNTPAVKAQLDAVKTQINAITASCDTEKEVITQEKLRWQWAFMGLALVMLAYFARKLLK